MVAGLKHKPSWRSGRGGARAGDVLLRGQPVYYDARAHDGAPTYWSNLGTLGEAADLRLGSTARAEIRDGPVGGRHLRLPGTGGNFAISSGAAAITGDISMVTRVALDDWSPVANAYFISRYSGTGQAAYGFRVTGGGPGNLFAFVSGDGTDLRQGTSTAPVPTVDGATMWVRVDIVLNTGSATRFQFFTQPDTGSNDIPTAGWTQLGTDVTSGAGIASIHASTEPVRVGSLEGATAMSTGRLYRAAAYSGAFSGSPGIDFNPALAEGPHVSAFTAATGEVWSIRNPTSRIASGPGGLNLALPGVNGNYASTPDSVANSVTGAITIMCRFAPDTAPPGVDSNLVGKEASGTARMFRLRYLSAGTLTLLLSNDGTNFLQQVSSVPLPITSGERVWVRCEWRPSDGRVQFHYAADQESVPTTWTQLGTDGAIAYPSLFDATGSLEVGGIQGGTTQMYTGRIYRAQLYDGLHSGGAATLVADCNLADTEFEGLSWRASTTGEVWTVTQNGATGVDTNTPTWLPYTGEKYAYFPGIAGNFASTTGGDLNALVDLDVRARVAFDDWTPAADQHVCGRDNGDPNRGWWFGIRTTGRVFLTWFPTGSVASRIDAVSTVAPSVADGGVLWIRAALDVDNGAGAYTVTFYTSTDGTTWTVLGAPVVGGATTSLASVSAALGLSAIAGSQIAGRVYRVTVLASINGAPLKDFDAALSTEPHTSVPAVTGETWAITRASSGRKLALVDRPLFLFGTDDYAVQLHNIQALAGGLGALSAFVAQRAHGNAAATISLFTRRDIGGSTGAEYWALLVNSGAASLRVNVNDGVLGPNAVTANAIRDGVTRLATLVLDAARSSTGLRGYVGATLGVTFDTTGLGDIDNTSPVVLGGQHQPFPTVTGHADMECVGAGIATRALTESELAVASAALGVPT
jgi:hypothetical protein